MANTDFIQATIEIFGCIITVVVAIGFAIITGKKNRSEKDVFGLLLASGMALLVDAGWYIFDGNTSNLGFVLNELCNFAIFICNPVMAFLLLRYVCNLIRERGVKPNKTIVYIVYGLIGISAIIPLSNLFYEWMYSIDYLNIYHRLSGWYLYTVSNSLSILLCIILVVIHNKHISVNRRITLYIFLFIPVIGIALQSLALGISFIQLGNAIGGIGIVISYLIDWLRSEGENDEVSEEAKKIRLIECVFFILILFISASIFSSAVSVKTFADKNSEQSSVSIAYMVSETVKNTLSEPVNVSKTMAQSDVIIEALSADDIKGTEIEQQMLDYMKRIKDAYGYQNIFVASDKTKAYYSYDGFARYMSDEEGAFDEWYFKFKENKSAYELNIDADKDKDMILSVFVNMEVRDDSGEFLGICGVTMSMEAFLNSMSKYETDYDIDIALTDMNGRIQVATDREVIQNGYINVFNKNEKNYGFSYERERDSAFLTKYLDGYGWHLVVRDNNPNKINVLEALLPSMVIYLIGIIVMFLFVAIIRMRDRRRNTELHVTKQQSEAAQAASEAKGRFLANMSHEIRTPINAVLGMDTMILRETHEPQIKEYAMNIRNAGNTLLSLINDILDISKIESGKMEIVPVKYDFATLINDVMNMVTLKADAKGLDVELEIDNSLPTELYGDDVRIRQIIVNLMNNSVKYTEKGKITLIVNGEATDDLVKLNICVKDTGIGIKEEDIEKLFEDYVRIEESRNNKIEGTGLGMSITMQLLEMMNSRLNVSSVYGSGSEFSFILEQKIVNSDPVGDINLRLRQNAENFNYEAMFVAPDAHILVVDDNDINRMVFVNLLKETKIQIDEASGGLEALDLIFANPYDIIFLDHMMPDMDGIEVVQWVKASKEHPNGNTPVIALTANAISGAKETYLQAGFNDYLSKPIIPEQLEKVLSTLLPSEKLIVDENMIAKERAVKDEVVETELPIIPGVDWSYARLHFADDNALMKTAGSFAKSIDYEADEVEKLFEELMATESAADEEALDMYRIKVHAMKSTATLLGFVPIAGMAATLEYAARDGEIDTIRDMTPHFISSWRGYKDQLSFAIQDNSDKIEIKDSTLIVDYVNQLKEAMQMFDVHGADAAIDKLKTYKYAADIEELFDKISVAVNNLDVDEVVNLCDAILAKFKA